MRKYRIISLMAAIMLTLSTTAASIETDRTWYLAGEAMTISITADDALIAYAELCDVNGLVAGTAVALRQGKGVGTVELPQELHSGYYALSVYTRHDSRAEQRLVAVVNPLRRSADDAIQWVATTRPDSLSYPEMAVGEDAVMDGTKSADVRETEGHIIKARIGRTADGPAFSRDQIRPTLSVVGKQIHHFEGKMTDDSTAVFYTYGIGGKLPLVIQAQATTGASLPVAMVSPFATLLPRRLPGLVFHYRRSEVEARSLDMQRHQMAIAPRKRELQIGDHADEAAEEVVPLGYDDRLFGTKPDKTYNLDEYRQFLTIREALLEYVIEITKRKVDDATRLFIRRDYDDYNAISPTLVLIDGIPVNDTERLLDYDARRLHYINIYNGQYTFGRGIYSGVISFVTRSGRLTNYPVDSGAQYLVYEFPE